MYAIKNKKPSKNVSSDLYLSCELFPHWTNGSFKRFDTRLLAEQKAMKIGLHRAQYKVVKL